MTRYQKIIIFEIVIIYIFVAICLTFYRQNPPPWPDEPLYLTLVQNLVTKGYLGTDIYGDSVAGMQRAMFFYPPVYFISLAPFVKIFGPSLLVMRIFSICCSAVSLVFIVLIFRRLIQDVYVRYLTLFAIAFNAVFLRGSRVGRMEALLLMFVMAATYFFMRYLEDYKERSATDRHLVLVAVFTGLACLTHPIAVFIYAAVILTLLIAHNWRDFLKSAFVLTAIPLVLAVPWGVYIFYNLDYFVAQFAAQMARKDSMVLMIPSLFPVYYLAVPFLILLVGYIYYRFRKGEPSPMDTVFILITAVLAGTMFSLSREMWYQIYPLVFGLMILGLFADLSRGGILPVFRQFFAPLFIVLIFLGAVNIYHLFADYSFTSMNYGRFCKGLGVDDIPPGARLYFGGIPEPYFCFKEIDRYKVLGLVAEGVTQDKEKWAEDLKGVDYFFLSTSSGQGSDFLIKQGVMRELRPVRRVYYNNEYSITVYK